MTMAIVTIEAVLPDGVEEALAGGLLAPLPGEGSDTYSFNLRGWAASPPGTEIVAFRALDGDRVCAEVPPNQPVAGAGAEVDGAVGFEMLVRAIELAPRFSIRVVAVLADGSSRGLAELSGSRQRLAVPREPGLDPAMITTIGRSGSKWLARLLSCHQEVLAFQPLVFEPRVATYWMTVLRELTAPKSYLRQIHTERWDQPRWWLGDGAVGLPAPVDLGMAEWLGTESVRQLAAICQERIEAYYREVARRSGAGEGVRYFAEKFLLDPVLLDLTTEVFPRAREVILVRDFRDRLSSVFAWNEKRGDHGFGHDAEMSKAEYLVERVRGDADDLIERWRRRGEEALLVRYEDLILEPEATLTGLFAYLGVAADEPAVRAVLEQANRPTELLDTHRTVSDPMQTIGRWRRDLPADLAAESNELLAPVLEAFGYEP
jgi:Sulfotransferase family